MQLLPTLFTWIKVWHDSQPCQETVRCYAVNAKMAECCCYAHLASEMVIAPYSGAALPRMHS